MYIGVKLKNLAQARIAFEMCNRLLVIQNFVELFPNLSAFGVDNKKSTRLDPDILAFWFLLIFNKNKKMAKAFERISKPGDLIRNEVFANKLA